MLRVGLLSLALGATCAPGVEEFQGLAHAKRVLGDIQEYLADRCVEEYGWAPAEAARHVEEYAKFWVLLANATEETGVLCASETVDYVWHEHILSTKAYARQTQEFFGKFLHHNRAVTPAEKASIPAAYKRTRDAYWRSWGEPPAEWGAAALSQCSGGDESFDPYGVGLPTPVPTPQLTCADGTFLPSGMLDFAAMDAFCKGPTGHRAREDTVAPTPTPEAPMACPVELCKAGTQLRDMLPGQQFCHISAEDAYAGWQSGTLPFMLDVRSSAEWAGEPEGDAVDSADQNSSFIEQNSSLTYSTTGHVDGAYLVPDFHQKLAEDYAVVTPCRNTPTVVACYTGPRSLKVFANLADFKFSCVFYLIGGLKAWVEAGNPTVRGTWMHPPLGDVCPIPDARFSIGEEVFVWTGDGWKLSVVVAVSDGHPYVYDAEFLGIDHQQHGSEMENVPEDLIRKGRGVVEEADSGAVVATLLVLAMW